MANRLEDNLATSSILSPAGGEGHRVAVIVAHPDDETLWAGGLLMSHPGWAIVIVTLCRGKDPDRAPRFARALACLHASGRQGDLEDGPEQAPLPGGIVRDAIRALLPASHYDLVLTHGPGGEYTRHRRHEEVSRAVLELWRAGELGARRVWQFAYEDGGGAFLPRPRRDANLHFALPEAVWDRKYSILTDVYGFDRNSWEARVTPRIEAFDCIEEQDLDPWPEGAGPLLVP